MCHENFPDSLKRTKGYNHRNCSIGEGNSGIAEMPTGHPPESSENLVENQSDWSAVYMIPYWSWYKRSSMLTMDIANGTGTYSAVKTYKERRKIMFQQEQWGILKAYCIWMVPQ